MNALERLAKAGTNSVGQYSFIDADTLRDPENPQGKGFRLQGYDAPEIAGFKGGKWKAGTAGAADATRSITCLLYTSPSPRDRTRSRMPSSA